MTEAIDYTQNTGPALTDELIGIDAPSGSWALNRYPIADIIALASTIQHKIDATTAPDADNDTDEGYSAGSIWVDVTNDVYYVCVDATDGAAVWQAGTATGTAATRDATDTFSNDSKLQSGSAIKTYGDANWAGTVTDQIIEDDTKVEAVDNGVDAGVVNIVADGSTVATFAAAGNTLGPMAINKALPANNSYSSTELIVGINGGETITQWQLVYYDTTATEWMLADADASGEAPAWGIAVAATSNGSAAYIMTRGFVRYDTWAWTPNAVLYLADTPGGLTETAPSTSGDIVQPVGRAVTAAIVYFNFDPINGYYTVD